MVTYHRYPLIHCFTQPGDRGYPTIPNLLSPDSSRDLLQDVGPLIALAHEHGATFRVDELNSVACKGQVGVSDTFASSLWMLDTLFAMARSGVDGVNIHTLPEAVYHPFTFERVNGRWLGAGRTRVLRHADVRAGRPARLEAPRRIEHAGLPTSGPAPRSPPQGLIHVVLINDSLTTDHIDRRCRPRRRAQAPRSSSASSAPSASATDGVTLAGQSFGTETATGTLTGRSAPASLSPVNGQYVIELPASSAAMVSFAPAATGPRPGPRTGAPR